MQHYSYYYLIEYFPHDIITVILDYTQGDIAIRSSFPRLLSHISRSTMLFVYDLNIRGDFIQMRYYPRSMVQRELLDLIADRNITFGWLEHAQYMLEEVRENSRLRILIRHLVRINEWFHARLYFDGPFLN